MINYIGISGGIGAGKDTLATGLNGLAKHLWPGKHVARLGFADLVKEQVIAAFNVPRALAYGTQADKRTPLDVNPALTIRDALKIIGKAHTDVEPTYYTRRAFEAVQAYLHSCRTPGDGVALFSDVRFPHEADQIRLRGGRVIRLLRQGGTEEERASWTEHALDEYTFDAVVDNRECSADVALALTIQHLKRWGMIDGEAF